MNRKAKTTKVISGNSIPTIPIGTEFEVISTACNDSSGRPSYVNCKGLPIFSIWLDEFEYIGDPTETK